MFVGGSFDGFNFAGWHGRCGWGGVSGREIRAMSSGGASCRGEKSSLNSRGLSSQHGSST